MRTATVVLYFNKPTLTRRCLASIHINDTRLVLVDNGSVEPLPQAPADASHIHLAPNQGFARGMNAGLREAFAHPEVELVALLSNDLELAPDFQAALSGLDARAPAIYCPHVYYLIDRAKPAYTHGTLSPEAELAHHFEPALTEIVFPRYYPAAATVWTRAAFERLGGFDERYFCYWEDVELSHRARGAEVKLVSSPGLRVHHLGRGTTGGKKGYGEHFERGRELTLSILGKRE